MARAIYIVVLGPDGSGKTTVADCLATKLRAEGHAVSRHDFSFGIMPPISSLLRMRQRDSAPEGQRDSGMVKPLNPVRAAILACWYGIDHLMGRWRLRRGPPGELVIFARSYHDFLYQRAYLKLPVAIPRLFLAVGPKPHLIVTPRQDPRAIHDRKPELTVAEIGEQYARIARRLVRYPYFSEIDASGGVGFMVRRIREKLNL